MTNPRPSVSGSVATANVAQPLQLAKSILWVLIAALFLRPWDQLPQLAALKPVSALIAALALVWWLDRPRIQLFVDPPAKPLWTLFLLIAATAPLSYWPSKSGTIAFEVLQQIAVFTFIAHLTTSQTDLTRVTRLIVLCSAIHGGLAAATYLIRGEGVEERVFGMGQGSFADPNDLALALVMVFPLAWWSFRMVEGGRRRIVSLAALLAILAGVLATQSRGGMMALAAVIAVVVWRSRDSLVPLLGVLVVAATVAVASFPAEVFSRYTSIVNYRTDESATTRLAIWKAGAHMFADHPLLGVGAGAFEVAYGAHYIDRAGAGNVWRAAHNSYIQAAAELGVCGLAAWLALIASGFVVLRRARRAIHARDALDPRATALLAWIDAATASLTGYMVAAVFLSRAYDMVLVIVLALASATWRILSAERIGGAGEHREAPPLAANDSA